MSNFKGSMKRGMDGSFYRLDHSGLKKRSYLGGRIYGMEIWILLIYVSLTEVLKLIKSSVLEKTKLDEKKEP
jgi:hypothetical protein